MQLIVCMVISAPLSGSLRHSQVSRDGESMLLNVAGKLMVFQRDRSGPQILDKDKSSPHKQQKPVSCTILARLMLISCTKKFEVCFATVAVQGKK